jgi:hypothetical protein
VILAAMDNWRGVIGANHLATRMAAPLVKANIDPNTGVASVRVYDLRRDHPPVCAECQFNEQHYARQGHPRR